MSSLAVQPDELFDLELKLLLEAVYLRYQYDFRQYALSSLRRRVRQALGQLGYARIAELQQQVLRDPQLFARLLQFMTVQVSEMFRDPAQFAALRRLAVPELQTYPSLKVWVAGCADGEEVWSLAILLHEEGLLERCLIYATDINEQALARAEAGVYPLDRAARFSGNYLAAGGRHSLSHYFTEAYGSIVFDRALRRPLVFADHSLATDAVFSEVHLVFCRNVLIYFDRSLQDRAVGLFRDALVRRGFLGLGSRETLQFGAHAGAFEPLQVDAGVRLYRRK
ncbi:MAG: protein-glutamate O-methyltransferase CheR [Rubrivivax sp.]